MTCGVVVIGRNEGERLKRCLQSLARRADVVYVDSGSADGSAERARGQGVSVIALDTSAPYTAARSRNAGYHLLRQKQKEPGLRYIQFVDADCELAPGWLDEAVAFMEARPDAGAVCGRLREREPERSVYNWLCDREWDGPAGEIRATGGIVMVRADAFDAVGGFREDVIAAEDDELCLRMRGAGWRIWRITAAMGVHDAAMTRFGQWWRRAVRAGYAFAQGAYLHGMPPERHFVWESRRAWLWGVALPLVCLAASFAFPPWGILAWVVYPVQGLRQFLRNPGSLDRRATLAVFQVLARFPEALGQLRFLRDRLLGRQARIIEYK